MHHQSVGWQIDLLHITHYDILCGLVLAAPVALTATEILSPAIYGWRKITVKNTRAFTALSQSIP